MSRSFTALSSTHLLSPAPVFFTLRYTFAMIPNQNLRIHNIHRLGSPLPPFKCPHCPRHFRSKGGHTKHIQAKQYANESEPLGSSPSSSPSPSSSQNSSRKSHEP